MGRITIIVPHLGCTDMNYCLLKDITNYKQNNICDIHLMYENDIKPFFNYSLPKMSVGRLWQDQSNDGVIIATSLSSAKLISKLPSLKRKIFYIWSLEHMWFKQNFFENIEVYNNIELVTRSDSYAKAIHNYTNILPKIIEDFNIKEIIKCQ